ncbi:MAG TPA: transcriptional regulator [Planctomycetes bacterium]|nr:transcriptional regulator [Planctomycetota bacterium]
MSATVIPNRDKCVVTLDRSSAPRIVHYGENFLRERFPEGTRVIYPPPPLDPLPNVKQAIRHALAHPEGCDPLFALVKPGMKVTIGIDDISLPLPPMRTPDVRQEILEVVVDLLHDYGVDDITMIVALSLHRRMTDGEIRRMVGPRIWREFAPDRLFNHDAEDSENMVKVGETEVGEQVVLNRYAVEADLVIYVNVNLVPMDGGHKSVGVGFCGYETLQAHHNPETLAKSMSFMDPEASELATRVDRIGKIVQEHLNVFTIETTLNNDMYGGQLGFLTKNEDDWTGTDELAFKSLKWTLDKLPHAARRAFFHKIPAEYGVTGVVAGRTEAVHPKTLEACFRQYSVPVEGQADILVTGIPFLCPYNVNSIMNPLLVHCTALGYFFNMYRGDPLLRKNGVMIIAHPLRDEWHPDHHPSYIEFFHRLLPETRDSHKLSHKYEQKFASDPAYVQMYRYGNAFHGVHPFYMWYWGEAGKLHCGKVICVGATNQRVAEILGWDTAPSIDEAIGMARAHLADPDASITLLHHPPIVIPDVTK